MNKDENVELSKIIEKYQYEKSIRKHAEKYFDYYQRSNIHSKIKTNDDVLLEKKGLKIDCKVIKKYILLLPKTSLIWNGH